MAHTRKFKRIFHSVFTKLLVVIVLTGFGISFLIGGFFVAYRHLAGEAFEENMRTYAEYLINDIGSPPSRERAQAIAAKTGLAIRYESPNLNWSTAAFDHALDYSDLHIWHRGRDFEVGTHHGRYVVFVQRGPGRFIFELSGRFADEERVQRLAVLFFALLLILLVLAYFTIRRTLKPVRWLDEGVRQVGRGNFDHRVPLPRSGEFRDLAQSFNTMAQRVREMMRAKERLLLDVSHELRSPITRLKVALEFMEEGKIKASIRGDIDEMEKMVSDILETYRSFKEPGALDLKTVDLAALIADMVATFSKKPPGVESSGLDTALEIKLDPEKIKTAVRNLIANGIKYSAEDAEPVQVTLERRPDHARIEIRDHGVGIPADALPHVFEPFYRVDPSRSRHTGGYGLGLSLSKAIIQAHGGHIELESQLGRGTLVRLALPYQHKETDGKRRAEP